VKIARKAVLTLGMAATMSLSVPHAYADGLLAFSSESSQVTTVSRDPRRSLVVIGYDSSGNRVAQIFAPNETTPSKIINLDRRTVEPGYAPTIGKLQNTAYKTDIQSACEKYNVDPALVRAVVHAESGFNPHAISPVGAAGLMQLMPATADRFGVTNRFNPSQSINGGVEYLSFLLNLFGEPKLAVAAYNAGENAVVKYGGIPPYSETQAYVVKVMSLWNKYRQKEQG
jgi:soluble lytic murein transglycosylase-like protein